MGGLFHMFHGSKEPYGNYQYFMVHVISFFFRGSTVGAGRVGRVGYSCPAPSRTHVGQVRCVASF